MERNRSYSSLVVLLLVPCLIVFSLKTMAITTNSSTDQSALLALKVHISHDPSNILAKSWTTNTSVCGWFGITCDFQKRVAILNLGNMNLSGTIPPHLGNLSFLVELHLLFNSFQGSLPDELSRLQRLKVINFSANKLTGKFPSWVGLLPNLEELYLGHNEFLDGPIPETIFNTSSPLKVIALARNQLLGTLPPALFNMSSLLKLDISENKLSATRLPADMFKQLSNLQILSMGGNKFYGEIPSSLFSLNQVEVLALAGNNFSGNIRAEIKNLTLLTRLDLYKNSFTGNIPREIGNLTRLTILELASNHFQGGIPQEVASLPNMLIFNVERNNLGGPIPLPLFNISTLTSIGLGGGGNEFFGSLPSNFGLSLPNLESLFLGPNKLLGLIPESISNCSKLIKIELSGNSFFGSIPRTLRNLRNLEVLNLHSNNLTDDPDQPILTYLAQLKNLKSLILSNNPLKSILPISIGNFSSIQWLEANYCGILGSIPSEIGNLTSVIDLELAGNGLNGPIPPSIGRLRNLQGLFLDENNLNGQIPDELCQLDRLGDLYIGNNYLSGPLPQFLNRLTSLRTLSLYSNNISSTIPSSLWDLSFILILDLSSNFITGSLPLQIANLKVVTFLDISSNQLSGYIPSQIAVLTNLQEFYLDHNQLQGSIPSSFGKLISLEFLDLTQNHLTGEIPKSLEALMNLQYINLSYNRLSGEIPSGGPFVNFSADSFIHNGPLCGPHRFQVPPCKTKSRGGFPRVLKIILPGIASATLILVVVFVFRKGLKKRVIHFLDANMKQLGELRRVSYFELQRATNGFDETNVLGVGSFGTVYKGTLSDGKEVAVKVFNLQHEETYEAFDSECIVLCNIRHRNIVKVVSCCSNMDFKAIVLDYMPHGSLEKLLYSFNCYLNMIQRLSILIDVAEAIEYLHFGCLKPIIHCDLKPSNILLDENMVACVTDFGMARLLSGQEIITQTLTLATIGYMAPEYGLEGVISTRGDVYSFGILVMETFTRKKPTDEIFSGETSLKSLVEKSFPSALVEIIDPNLLSNGTDEFESEKFCISKIIEVALGCCQETPEERTNMKEVVTALHKIKTKLLKYDDHWG